MTMILCRGRRLLALLLSLTCLLTLYLLSHISTNPAPLHPTATILATPPQVNLVSPVSDDSDSPEDGIDQPRLGGDSALQHRSDSLLGRIRRQCEEGGIKTKWKYPDKPWRPYRAPRVLILQRKAHVLYSTNPKTGSTSFKKFLFLVDSGLTKQNTSPEVLLSMQNVHNETQGHFEVIESRQQLPSESDFERLLKFVVIRNPLSRLVSGFRDKQLRREQFMKPGVHYPANYSEGEIFRAFVTGPLRDWLFLENIHFKPQWLDISICSWPYNLVVEYERMSVYIPYLQRLTGTEDFLWPGSRSEQGEDEFDSMHFVREYAAHLDEEAFKLIHTIYKRDYELFGYSKFGEEGFPFIRHFP